MQFPISTKAMIAIGIILITLREITNAYKTGSYKTVWLYLKSTPWKTSALYLMGIALIVAPLIFLDPVLRPWIQSLDHIPALTGYIEIGRFFGRNIWFCLIVAYAVEVLFIRKKLSNFIFRALLGTALTGLAVHILKYTLMRARPDAGLGHLYFFHYQEGLPNVKSFLSMPSGDVAISAGAFAFVICALQKGWARWLLLAFPVATGFSRIILNRHWPSDTLASLLLSFLIGYWLAQYKQTSVNK